MNFAVGVQAVKVRQRAFHDLEPEGRQTSHNFSYMSMVSKLCADDVLHHGCRMDALLLFMQWQPGKLDGKDSAQVADYFTGLSGIQLVQLTYG